MNHSIHFYIILDTSEMILVPNSYYAADCTENWRQLFGTWLNVCGVTLQTQQTAHYYTRETFR